MLKRTVLVTAKGESRAFGDWLVADVTADALLQYRELRQVKTMTSNGDGKSQPRRTGGPVAVNRNLALLRAAFNWAILAGLVEHSPFKRGTETAVKLTKEARRARRLHEGEEARLLSVCSTHLRSVVEAALETGCRVGELLSLQWAEVALQAREIRLRPTKTKTSSGRRIPISTRLKAILDMRRAIVVEHLKGPDGSIAEDELDAAYVFGSDIGMRLRCVRTAWNAACRRAGIVGLHFHDLRREAGSRWVDTGVPLHLVQRWLGHTNISQTSTYLQADSSSARTQAVMREHEQRWARLHPDCIPATETRSLTAETPDAARERSEYAGNTQQHAAH